jgi:hypothetical protein
MRCGLISLVLLACAGKDDQEPPADEVADTDTDTDSDTDSDADTDTDSDADSDTDTDTDSDADTDTGEGSIWPAYDCFGEGTWDYEDDGYNDNVRYLGFASDYDTEAEYEGWDYYVDGSIDYELLVTRDAEGHVLRWEQRYYGFVSVQEWTYDAQGLPLTYTLDEDGDGNSDYAIIYLYDAYGVLLSLEEDHNGDGTTDEWYTYLYDTDGHRIQGSGDLGNDGTVDDIWTAIYPDPLSNDHTATWDYGNDGIPDESYLVDYDDAGRLVYYEEDTDLADAALDYTYAVVYDEITGLMSSSTVLSPEYEYTDTFTYDTFGRELDHDRDLFWPQLGYGLYIGGITTYGGTCP